jgi:Bacterial Ig domain
VRLALATSLIATALLVTAPAGHSVCGAGSSNPIVIENCKPGTDPSEWDISGAGEDTIQGFATDISVNRGQTVTFKVDTVASSYRLDIYRMGYYQGKGARLVGTVTQTVAGHQPPCDQQSSTGLVDCSNWTPSATWKVPDDAVSGIYFAAAVRTDNTPGASHIFFIVRDDASHSDVYYQTSDTTWQAYNHYGEHGLYFGGPRQDPGQPDRATKVSYNRPFTTRQYSSEDWVFNAEYPMVRWLERNGYDVTYETGVDSDRLGSLIRNHKVFLSSGHDEYWSGQQRANVTAARDAGVNLAFFSGNEVFWKTRWEDDHRTLVTYKETHANPGTAETGRIDPSGIWTGTWMDPRFNAEHRTPQNALTGTLFTITAGSTRMQVPAAYGALRFWRNTSIARLAPGQTATLGDGDTVGYEWDSDVDNGFRPPGLFDLSSTKHVGAKLTDYGSNYSDLEATHSMTIYRAPSGALVFGAGTVQWAWGLDKEHDGSRPDPVPDMQQATVNLLADMHVQPSTLQSELTAATASTDTIAPQSTITSPVPSTVTAGQQVNISGTAADAGGGHVAGVEVSVDGGATWHPAVGHEQWGYVWFPTASGHPTFLTRAVDDSGNLGPPPPGTTSPGSGSGGSGGSASSGASSTGGAGTTAKKAAARLTLAPRTVRASKAGIVKLRVTCPGGTGGCRVALRLALGKRVLATKSLTVRAGTARTVALSLTRAARRDLVRKRSLKVTAIAVTDRNGSRATTRTSVLLLPPRKQ